MNELRLSVAELFKKEPGREFTTEQVVNQLGLPRSKGAHIRSILCRFVDEGFLSRCRLGVYQALAPILTESIEGWRRRKEDRERENAKT